MYTSNKFCYLLICFSYYVSFCLDFSLFYCTLIITINHILILFLSFSLSPFFFPPVLLLDDYQRYVWRGSEWFTGRWIHSCDWKNYNKIMLRLLIQHKYFASYLFERFFSAEKKKKKSQVPKIAFNAINLSQKLS